MKRYKKPNRIVQVMFFLLRNNWISILFGLLFIIFAFFLLTFSEKTNLETKAWYSSNWQYRRDVEVENGSGLARSDEDVLVIVDTSSLITAGKMQSSCNDIRFVDSDDSTLLSYWIEDGCNTTSTQIWVRIPLLPVGGKTIYLYYGNAGASSASMVWNGNVVMFADTTCPSGWTRVSAMDDKFLYGSTTYGSTGGTDSHAHANVSVASTSISTTSLGGNTAGTNTGTTTTHTHTSLQASIGSVSSLPPYINMIMCSKKSFIIDTGLISMFSTAAPTGWTRFSALDDRMPRAASSYGATGGATTHNNHSVAGVSTTSSPSGTQGSHTGSTATVASGTHTHTNTNATLNQSTTNVPPYQDIVFAKANGNNYIDSSNILVVSELPPLGWTRFVDLDNRFPRGATTFGATGGASTHTHTGTITTGGPSASITSYGTGANYASDSHTHSASFTTDAVSNIPPYYSVIYTQRKTSFSTVLSTVEQYVFTAAPSAPLNLVATYGDGQVTLGWSKPSDEGGGVTDYIVQYSNDGGSTWNTFNDGTSSNRYATVTGLTNGNLYTFRVAAVNPTGTSPYSNTVQSTPQALSITSISPTSGTYLGGGSMTINATGLGDSQKFAQVSAGTNHTCGLSHDGQGYCWGYNNSGQLGNGSTTNSNIPVLVSQGAMGSGVIFSSISAGGNHTCAIGSDGEGYCWGYNVYGQLGNGNSGSGTESNIPVLVSQGARDPGVTFSSISAGNNHTCGLGSDGNGYCWGSNNYGRLGNGGTGNSNIPVLVSQGARDPGVTFISISVGYQHTCAIGSDGNGYCWGRNNYGQLGNGSNGSGTDSNIPVLVSKGAMGSSITFDSISAGQYHTCAIGSDSEGYCWGSGSNGRLGNGGTGDSSIPVLVSQGARDPGVTFSSISAGSSHTCAIGSDGNGYCWGSGSNGRLGNGGIAQSTTPVLVSQGARPAGVTFGSIGAGGSHTCAIGSDGNGYCWGSGSSGQLGDGGTTSSTTPVLVAAYEYQITIGSNTLTQVIPISAGSTSITVVQIPAHVAGTVSVSLTRIVDKTTSNSVSYTYTNLPSPDITSITPSTVSPNTSNTFSLTGTNFLDYGPISNLTSVSAGNSHTCGLDSDGEGYCWGRNNYGQLGNGGTSQSTTPVLVSQGARDPGVTFSSISAGSSHTCAIGSDGEGYCWGSGSSGRLGNGGTGDSNIPVLVSQGARDPGVTFVSISAGNQHTCAIGSDGEGYCWGSGSSGRLGNGGTAQSTTPVLVSQGARDPGVTFISIGAGDSHTCVIGSDGEGYCWGYNYYGQLGNGYNGSGTDSNIPVLVSQGARDPEVTFSSISAGVNHTCAIGSDGEGYCWGYGGSGQLGNGGTAQSTTPVLVSQGARDPGVTFSSISVGDSHTCAIGSDGNGYCWGSNYYGELGNGNTGTNSNIPVLVNKGAMGSNVTFSSISVGNYSYTCGLGSDGNGYCWGYNYYGELGNNETTDRLTPSYVIIVKSPTIEFGSTSATSTTYTSTTAMSAVSPTLGVGTIPVKLTNPDGQYDIYNIFAGSIPSAPLNLVATYGDGQVTLGWNKPSDEGGGVTDYIVQYSNDGGSTWNTFNDGTSSNRYATVTGLTNGNLYTFRVAAVNPAGTSTYSNTVQSTPQTLSITSISPTSGTYLGGGSMTINATGLGDSQKFAQVSAGTNHTCGLSHDGQGYCWGYNNSGQLGNGSTTNSNIPVLVSQGARDPGVTFISISVGHSHTCAVGSDGEGYCWGSGSNGRLGNGGTAQSTTPVLVSQGARDPGVTFISISAGNSHTCAIGSDGNGYCWGSGSNGRLGNGGTAQSTTPVLVSQGARDPGVTFSSISAGNNHTCGLGSDGEGYCWGYNYYGQLGNGYNGSGTDSNIPVLVSQGARDPGVTFSNISAGQYHTCAIGSDGNGYCWGYGRLGNGGIDQSTTPVLVSQGARDPGVMFSSISVGDSHTCAIGSDGNGYCWGSGSNGQLGNGGTAQSTTPVLVSQGARPAGVTFGSIGAGGSHTCAIGSDGNGYCWGYNYQGQLGNGSTTSSTTPVLVAAYEYQITIGSNTLTQVIPAGSTSITVAQIPAHAVGVVSVSLTRIVDNTTSNSVSYTYTNLPSPDITSITPSTVSPNTSNTFSLTGTNFLDYGPISNLTSVSAGGSHTCAIGSDGNGYCWGSNYYGQLGNGYNGSGTDSNIPVLVSKGAMGSSITFDSISAGDVHTCGLGSDGEGYCWGYNYYGQLGNGYNGSGTDSNIPVLVSQGARDPGVTFISISAGDVHTCAIGSDGNGYCWGYNWDGELGNGSSSDSNIPVLVSQGARDSGVTFSSMRVGSYHTCAIGSNGEGYCWGYNYYGQLGNGGTAQSTTPVLVSQGARDPGVTFSSISVGDSHTCAIGSDGNGYCWGSNYYGELGNGNTGTNSNIPVLVSRGARDPGVTFISISAGSSHTCAIGSDGEGYCWGYGSDGRLGDGGTGNSNIPVLVGQGIRNPGVTISSISAGYSHTCAIGSDGQGFCWGYNYYGELGNNETTDRLTPSYVIIIKSPTIEFGSTPATSTTYTSTTAMSAVSPVLSVGTVAVKLTNPDGQYDTYDILVQSPPTVPLNLGATAGNTQVVLTWNVPSSDGGSSITDYIIQYSTDNSTWTTFNDGTSTNTTATVTGLTNRTLYYFRVAAVNSIGTGPYTSSVTATPVNPLPTVTNVTLNGGNAITLVEGNTKSVTLTAQVINDTGCTEITSVKGYLYRSGKGYTNCNNSEDADGNFCYPEIGCSVDTGSCTGSTDYTADYTCTVSVQYFADPTDTGTLYDSENWLATIKATNSGDLSTSTEVTTGVEMNSLTAFSVTSTLSYSDLLVGESNNPLDRVLTTTATGNVGLDQEHKGEGIGMCTDYPTCEVGTPIALSHQKYSLTASTPYSTPTTAISLTNTSVEVELNLAKPTSTTAVSKNTWWGVFIPPGTLPGYYQGRNTITAVKGETTHW